MNIMSHTMNIILAIGIIGITTYNGLKIIILVSRWTIYLVAGIKVLVFRCRASSLSAFFELLLSYALYGNVADGSYIIEFSKHGNEYSLFCAVHCTGNNFSTYVCTNSQNFLCKYESSFKKKNDLPAKCI